MLKVLKNSQTARLGILLVSILFMIGCDQRDLEDDVTDIHKVMKERQAAIENRSLQQFGDILFSDYKDAGVERNDVMGYMSMMFESYENITYSYQKIRPDVKMNTARIVHKIEYNFNDGEKFFRTQETVILRWYDGNWTISGGIKLGFL